MYWTARKFTSKFKCCLNALLIGLGGLSFQASAQVFDLQAHRGGRGLLPENTLAAFENAIRMGVRTIEMDIAITADGIPVISHDPALNPALTRDASGRWLTAHDPLIKNMRLAEVQTYDVGRLNPAHPYAKEFPTQQARDGQRIPTLASVFDRVNRLGAHDIQFDIETKINPHYPNNTLAPEAFVQNILSVFRQYGFTKRIMVQSFDWRTLEILHREAPEIKTMYLTMDFPSYSTIRDGAWTGGRFLVNHQGSVPQMIKHSAGQALGVIWAPNFQNLTPETLREAKALGMLVIPWTVNETLHMRKLIEWNVDGIITDYPNLLRGLLIEKGLSVPKALP
jgi:glycerophosphoryl diester phosphodiesterase